MRDNSLLICSMILIAAAVFCMRDGAAFNQRLTVEHPVVNLPSSLRQANWSRGGSCVHACLVSLLRWQGEYNLADRWRRTHSGGERWFTMASDMDEGGIKYALHTDGDPAFLEWAIMTRRGAAIQIRNSPASKSFHMVTLVDLTPLWAGVLDNNDPRIVKWIRRDVLLINWQRSNGWAFTPVYSPAAPMPPQRRDRT